MINSLIRLILVIIITAQAAYIYIQKGWRDTYETGEVETVITAEVADLNAEIEALKAVLEIKNKVIEGFEVIESDSVQSIQQLQMALQLSYEEIERINEEMLVSFGTLEETGVLLAEISKKLKNNTISGDELTALFTLMGEVQFLDETPEDYAAFHASFLGNLLGLERVKMAEMHEVLLDYSQYTLEANLVKNARPADPAQLKAWDTNRKRINDEATESIQELLTDKEYLTFRTYYPTGVLNKPEFGIKPISRPIILSKEDFARSGGQIFLRDTPSLQTSASETVGAQ